MFIIYIVSLTEYAVHINVIMVVMMQINKNLKIISSRTPTYEMIETVEGIKRRTMFLSKKSAATSICSTFINLKIKHKKSKIIASTLPGKGMVSMFATISPKIHMIKILKTCFNNFKSDTPEYYVYLNFITNKKICKLYLLTNVFGKC